MAEAIRMPKMSDTMSEGVIASWQKKVGDSIKSGDIIAEVETDKATMDLESYQEGTLLYIGVQAGEAVAIDGIIAIVGKAGEEYGQLLNDKQSPVDSQSLMTIEPLTTNNPLTINNSLATSNINAVVVRMPKMSDTMTEGVLVSWLKKVGDKVKSGDILAEVETDKATMELENYEDGTLLYVGVEAGQAVAVDGVIAIIGEEGVDYSSLLSNQPSPPALPTGSGETQPALATTGQMTTNDLQPTSDSRLKASPLAKAIAKEKGIDLSKVSGTGEGGRIVKKDVDSPQSMVDSPKPQVASSQAETKPTLSTPSVDTENYEDTPVSQMRKTIARRLSESMFTAPHFYVTMEINMDKAAALRATINEVAPTKISFNDFVVKASALALRKHPAVNSSWLGDKIRKNNVINIGVAVAVDEGLLVPVVRNADLKTMSVIGAEVKDFAGKAKDKKLQPKDWEGNTFSISNLGMFGVDEFTAIINPPDSCILAVGGIKQTAGFKEDGSVYPTSIMKVTLSCDHRVVDGATAASFLQTIKKYLESPMLMLV